MHRRRPLRSLPVSVSVVPLPLDAGLTVPEIDGNVVAKLEGELAAAGTVVVLSAASAEVTR